MAEIILIALCDFLPKMYRFAMCNERFKGYAKMLQQKKYYFHAFTISPVPVTLCVLVSR